MIDFRHGDVVMSEACGEIFIVIECCTWYEKPRFVVMSMVDGAVFMFLMQYFKLIHRVQHDGH